MASIVNVLSENALQLSQEEFVRGMTFGNSWNKVRVGMLVRVNGAATVNTARLHIGLNNGTTNTLASSTCSGYMAVRPGATPSVNYVYDGVNNRYNVSNSNYFFSYYFKIGNSVTESLIAAFTGDSYVSASTSAGFSLMAAEFRRTAVNQIQSALFYMTAAQYTFGTPTTSDLYAIMENEAMTGWAANWLTVTSFTTLSSLAAGLMQLDSVSIYWNNLATPLEIGCLMAAKYY